MNTGTRFVVPSVGLNVPLAEVSPVHGVVQPPGFTTAYRVKGEGVPVTRAAQGTVFVVMHSLRDGGVAPGNALIDVAAGQSSLPIGARIGVGFATTRWVAVDR